MDKNSDYLNSRFPEDLFPPAPEHRNEYYQRILEGRSKCNDYNVLITGLCRNIINVLPQTCARLRKTMSFFKQAKVLIYENDSDDGTSEALKKEFEGNNDVILVQEKTGHMMFGNTTDVERPLYLGKLRQKCNGFIRGINKFFPIDFVIVIDLDLEGGWSYDGIFNSFGYEEWSAITSNGILYKEKIIRGSDGSKSIEYDRLFYDTFAYKDYGSWKVLDCKTTGRKKFERGEKPFMVYSNFNGLGIYKYNDMIDCTFGAHKNPDGTVINEWSFMHNQMIKNGCDILLNPSMITLYSPTEYSL